MSEGFEFPINTGDPALNLSMVEKLINLDVLPIPMDYLPLEEENITDDYNKMYWPNGQRILAASRIIARDDRLHGIYMGNFRCGPDSFLAHFVHEEMAGKPYMEIEIDEHGADAGMITRYEAFLDSLRGSRMGEEKKKTVYTPGKMAASPMQDRVLYFPYLSDASHVIAAVCRSFGINSQSLPMQNQEDLDLARKYTSSRECFPMICTTGSFLKKLMDPETDPAKVSFFTMAPAALASTTAFSVSSSTGWAITRRRSSRRATTIPTNPFPGDMVPSSGSTAGKALWPWISYGN